jgi:Fe-S oxidoreductase
MDRIRENAYCCGAGGGVRTAFPDWAVDNVGTRIEEAEKTGAKLLVSTCPFCAQNFMTGIEKKGSSLEYIDLVDLLSRLAKN